MSEGSSSFLDLLRRVRAGEEAAATELVRKYEPAIRLAVRVRLTDPHLRRVMDSVDICQSILAQFFVRAASGQFDLERADQLLNLLVTMARNHLVNQVHKHHAACRDQRRNHLVAADEMALADRGDSPSQVVANQELLRECRRRLTEEERRIVDGRVQGRAWGEIAAEIGDKADAVRMRFHRALDRVVGELGLDE